MPRVVEWGAADIGGAAAVAAIVGVCAVRGDGMNGDLLGEVAAGGRAERLSRESRASVFLHALPVAGAVLALIYYWFGLANRYTLFLYYHDMGALVPDTAPFSPVTASRYWMAGLVAGGLVAAPYLAACWLAGRLKPDYQPPRWWRVWVAAGVPVLVGVAAITMTANAPTLPALSAAQTTVAVLVGMGLALAPGRIAARHPRRLIPLALDGLALAGVVLTVALSERAVWMLDRGSTGAMMMLTVAFAGSLGLLLVMTALLVWRRLRVPDAAETFGAGLFVAYLALPLLHYALLTGDYHYITNSDNLFSRAWPLQVAAWVIGAAIALIVAAMRRRLVERSRMRGLPVAGEDPIT